MSQIELGEDASPTTVTETEPIVHATGPGTSSRQLLRPSFQSTTQPRSALIAPSATTVSDEETRVHSRHVGARYLAQLGLTTLPLIVVDLILLTAAIVVARALVRYAGIGTGVDVSAFFMPIAAGFVFIAVELGLYPGIRLSPVEEFRRLAVSATLIFGIWTLGVVLLGEVRNQPIFLSLAFFLSLVNLWVFRGFARRALAKCSWWGFPTLICGDDPVAVKVYQWLDANKRIGLRPVALIADAESVDAESDGPPAGPWSAAREIAEQRGAFWAVVVPPEGATTALVSTITQHLSTIPHIHILSELTGLPDNWSRHQQLDGLTGIHLQQNLMLPLPKLTKRCIDLIGATLGGILLLPLLFYLAVAVKMSSRGPILYGHERIGKNGRKFRAWKFRTMFQNSNYVLDQYLEDHPDLRAEWERDHKLRYDPRTTRIGRFLRKTSLDELPQLWNVLWGEMSLVGPRPIVTAEIPKYGPYYQLLTMVTPGITGLWQVLGRNNTTYEERVQLDAYYVRNWSLSMDLFLLLKTIRIVLFAKGAY